MTRNHCVLLVEIVFDIEWSSLLMLAHYNFVDASERKPNVTDQDNLHFQVVEQLIAHCIVDHLVER